MKNIPSVDKGTHRVFSFRPFQGVGLMLYLDYFLLL
jgi:hypothetical protein